MREIERKSVCVKEKEREREKYIYNIPHVKNSQWLYISHQIKMSIFLNETSEIHSF